MAVVRLELKGDKELSAKMAKLGAQAGEITHDAAGEWGDAVADTARRKVPVRFGALKDSIHPEVNGGNAEVIADAVNPDTGRSYAGYVELGTGHGRSQPYLYPAFTEHRDVLPFVRRALMRRGVL